MPFIKSTDIKSTDCNIADRKITSRLLGSNVGKPSNNLSDDSLLSRRASGLGLTGLQISTGQNKGGGSLHDGRYQGFIIRKLHSEWMWKEDIDAIMKRSKAYQAAINFNQTTTSLINVLSARYQALTRPYLPP